MVIDARRRFGCRHEWMPQPPRRGAGLVCIHCARLVEELDVLPPEPPGALVAFSTTDARRPAAVRLPPTGVPPAA